MLSCAPFVLSSHSRSGGTCRTSPGWPAAHLDIRAGLSLPVRLGSQALGEVLDRDRVSILDRVVSGIEELEEDVGNTDRLQRAAKRLGAEIEEILVTLTGVDVNGLHLPQRVGVGRNHPHRVPAQPPFPDV